MKDLFRKSEKDFREWEGVPKDKKLLWLYGILLMTILKIHFKK